jgi:hypothetical protein
VLFNFDSKRIVDKWHVFTDASFGGKSQASISYNKQEQVIGSMVLFDLGPNPLRIHVPAADSSLDIDNFLMLGRRQP